MRDDSIYDEYEGVKGEEIDNEAELEDIIEYHKKNESGESPYSRIKYANTDKEEVHSPYY